MENVEVGSNLQIVVQRWGVFANHSATTCMDYKVMKKGKEDVLQKEKKCTSGICEKM
jgi:hypothetical protein